MDIGNIRAIQVIQDKIRDEIDAKSDTLPIRCKDKVRVGGNAGIKETPLCAPRQGRGQY